MEEETKSKIYSWVFWIVVLAGLGYCAKTGIEDSKREEAKRQEAQKEQKARIAAMEQKALVIQNELLRTHHARKFNVEEFRELNPKFTFQVSNFFQDNYPGDTFFVGLLKDISAQQDKYLVHIELYEDIIGSLDIFVVCPKTIVEKIPLPAPEDHFYRNEVYLVSHITSQKKSFLKLEARGGAINFDRHLPWKGHFIAEGTCVDLVLKPSGIVDPIDPKLEKTAPPKKHEQSKLPDNTFNSFKIIEESYGKEVRTFENTGGKEPSFEVKEKIALDLLNKLVKAPGPVKEAIYSVHVDRYGWDGGPASGSGHLDIPTSLTLVTYARGCNGPLGSRCSPNGEMHSRILYRATLTWEECCIAYPGGLGPEPIMDLYILQTTEPQTVISKEGSEERLENSIFTTQIFEVRKCAENSLICDVSVPTHKVTRKFDCDSMFTPNTNAQSLAERFGEENVTSGEVYLGEGDYEKGTVLFGGTKDQVDILWKDVENQQMPKRISIEGAGSSWMTQKGLSLGDDLLTVEKLNQTPFRLFGFLGGGAGGEGAGTQVSWSGGALEREETAKCNIRVRLMPDGSAWNSEWYRQVQGDSEYASSHPAMQALNPHIVEIRLEY